MNSRIISQSRFKRQAFSQNCANMGLQAQNDSMTRFQENPKSRFSVSFRVSILALRRTALTAVKKSHRPNRHISPIFGILGERLCAVRDFPTKGLAAAMAAGGRFRTACRIRRETKQAPDATITARRKSDCRIGEIWRLRLQNIATYAMVTYSASTDRTSDHHADAIALYSEAGWIGPSAREVRKRRNCAGL